MKVYDYLIMNIKNIPVGHVIAESKEKAIQIAKEEWKEEEIIDAIAIPESMNYIL